SSRLNDVSLETSTRCRRTFSTKRSYIGSMVPPVARPSTTSGFCLILSSKTLLTNSAIAIGWGKICSMAVNIEFALAQASTIAPDKQKIVARLGHLSGSKNPEIASDLFSGILGRPRFKDLFPGHHSCFICKRIILGLFVYE